jgi:hypothetical protein
MHRFLRESNREGRSRRYLLRNFQCASSELPFATTRLIRPRRSASGASMSLPVSIRSIALARPTVRATLRPARTREGAKRYLGMAEASVASGNHNIAHLDQLAAAAYGIAKSAALWRFSRPYIHAVIETSLPESGMEIFRAETGAPESAYLPKILIMVAPCDSGRRSCSAIGQLTPRKEAGQVSHLNLDYLLS